jgi:hypothetical protein
MQATICDVLTTGFIVALLTAPLVLVGDRLHKRERATKHANATRPRAVGALRPDPTRLRSR